MLWRDMWQLFIKWCISQLTLIFVILKFSGETGSGKTESTKLLLNFLAENSSKSGTIGKKIVQANPILEGTTVIPFW